MYCRRRLNANNRAAGRRRATAVEPPSARGNLKQQLVRVLIVEIVADIDEKCDEVLLLIQWSGGHHTQLRQARAAAAAERDLTS